MNRTLGIEHKVAIIKEVETGDVVERSLFSDHLVVERSRNHHY
jgi:hypothetical protein